jgi:hypothetical protein
MKIHRTLLTAVAVVASTVAAQDTDIRREAAADAALKKQQPPTEAELQAREANVIKRGRFTWRGVVPQARKSGNPLQLINPFAPLSAGSGEQNLVAPMPGDRAPGLAIISVE